MTSIAVPSRGRLREGVIRLLGAAGYGLGRAGTSVPNFIDMRTRDAAYWLAAGRVTGAFISTDVALESGLSDWPTLELGFGRSDLVIACRDGSPARSLTDLEGQVIATHLPNIAADWLTRAGVDATVLPMAGSLEGMCSAGFADAIVDLRQTGASLLEHQLRVLDTGPSCQAVLVTRPDVDEAGSQLIERLTAAITGQQTHFVMFHIPPEEIDGLSSYLEGLEAPTVVPLSGRDDLVAVHLATARTDLWDRLTILRRHGASSIVVLPVEAVMP